MEVNLFGLVFISVVIEGIVTYVKNFLVSGKFQWQVICAALIGIFVSITYGIDLFGLAGFDTKGTIVGYILTGILLSRGSSYVYELFDLVKNTTKQMQGKSS